MEERVVSFTLFGQQFKFFSDAPDDEVERAINLLRDELESTELAARSSMPSSTLLVLGALKLAARFVTLEKEYHQYRKMRKYYYFLFLSFSLFLSLSL